MAKYYFALCMITSLSVPSLQAPPFIANQPITVNLFESVVDDHQVACIQCIHTSNKIVRLVTINPVSVTQGRPHCLNCFTIRQISPISDFCIFYSKMTSPAQRLDFSLGKVYNIRIECTDNVESSTAVVDVRIIPNLPPVITGPGSVACPTPIDAITTGVFQNVYTGIAATDDDGANLFYSMTANPTNNVFDIDPDTGRIHTILPASRFCHHTVIFYVTVSDNVTTPLSPTVITCAISNYYTSPMVSNAGVDLGVREDVLPNTNVYTFFIPVSPLTVTYAIQSVIPTGATHLFTFNGNSLQAAVQLNFENSPIKDPAITFTASNGICPPETHSINLHILDANDAPVVSPKNVHYTFPENSVISFSPVQSITDDDFEDTIWDYSITGGNPVGLWIIDAAGQITTSIPYDLETHTSNVVLTVQVTDRKGPSFDTQTVTIAITDVNDNPPVFTQSAFVFTVTECDQPGFVAGRVMATDADTGLNNNNVVIFDVISSNNIAINGRGDVTLTSNVSVGMTTPVMVGAKDMGTPSLVTVAQASVSLAVLPCPIPGPSTPSVCNNGDSSNAGDQLWTQFAAMLAALFGSRN